jgi:hypothetical protein
MALRSIRGCGTAIVAVHSCTRAGHPDVILVGNVERALPRLPNNRRRRLSRPPDTSDGGEFRANIKLHEGETPGISWFCAASRSGAACPLRVKSDILQPSVHVRYYPQSDRDSDRRVTVKPMGRDRRRSARTFHQCRLLRPDRPLDLAP